MTTYHTRFVDIQLTQGVDAADITPYAGMWVPHNQLLELDSSWEFAPENEYDINKIPPDLNMSTPRAGAGPRLAGRVRDRLRMRQLLPAAPALSHPQGARHVLLTAQARAV